MATTKRSAQASIKLERISPRKARLVGDVIRYKNVPDAISILKNINKKAAPILLKVLNSAVANAVNNNGMEADSLVVSQVIINEGPTLKRMQPRGRGRAFSILKRTSSFMVEVSEGTTKPVKKETKPKAAAKPAAKKETKPKTTKKETK